MYSGFNANQQFSKLVCREKNSPISVSNFFNLRILTYQCVERISGQWYAYTGFELNLMLRRFWWIIGVCWTTSRCSCQNTQANILVDSLKNVEYAQILCVIIVLYFLSLNVLKCGCVWIVDALQVCMLSLVCTRTQVTNMTPHRFV